MSDQYEDLACSIERLKKELKCLRAEIVELTGAIFSLHPDYRGDE